MDWLIWYTVIRCLGKTVIVNEYTKEKKRNKGTGKQRKTVPLSCLMVSYKRDMVRGAPEMLALVPITSDTLSNARGADGRSLPQGYAISTRGGPVDRSRIHTEAHPPL